MTINLKFLVSTTSAFASVLLLGSSSFAGGLLGLPPPPPPVASVLGNAAIPAPVIPSIASAIPALPSSVPSLPSTTGLTSLAKVPSLDILPITGAVEGDVDAETASLKDPNTLSSDISPSTAEEAIMLANSTKSGVPTLVSLLPDLLQAEQQTYVAPILGQSTYNQITSATGPTEQELEKNAKPTLTEAGDDIASLPNLPNLPTP